MKKQSLFCVTTTSGKHIISAYTHEQARAIAIREYGDSYWCVGKANNEDIEQVRNAGGEIPTT